MGFRGKLISWFQNYLTNRDQKVCINNSLLISKPVISGVPQGSILGPMFFIIYMNNLPSCVSNTESLLFVDATKCFCNVSHPSDITMLQNDLSSVVSWSKAWGLNFNPSKSIHLSFKSKINSTYHILGSPITSQLSHKDLSIIISSNLSWDNYCKYIIPKRAIRCWVYSIDALANSIHLLSKNIILITC